MPAQDEQSQTLNPSGDVTVELRSATNGWQNWRTKHPTHVRIILFLIVSCGIIVVVVPPVCVLHGCGAGGHQPEPANTEQINRIMVSFDAINTTVKSKIPHVLYEFLEEISLDAGIQVVTFRDSATLEQVKQTLLSQSDLRIFLRDSAQYRLPQVDPWANFGLTGTRLPAPSSSSPPPAATRRRSAQQQQQQSPPPPPADLPSDRMPRELGDEYADKQWANFVVRAPQAWSISQGANVVVAVIDTGCDVEHPDLREHLWVNRKEIPNNNVDDDGNGYIDDVHGFDFAGPCANDFKTDKCGPRPLPQDEESHGTHCAGIVAAVRNNRVGIAGIAPNVSIMCLKVVPNDFAFYTAHILKALDYAVKMGAHIVSCSFGPSSPNLSPSPAEKEDLANQTRLYAQSLDTLKAKNMLLVAAAGNENTDLDLLERMGSAYNPCTMAKSYPDNVLCVMATNDKDERLVDLISNYEQGTNYGSRTVDIGAPGLQILSTVPRLERTGFALWANKTGSSMATPLVAGIGALVMSVLGTQSGNFYQGKEARTILLESADRLEGLPAIRSSRVNAVKAVQQAYSRLEGVSELVQQSGFTAEAQSVMMEGFNETYLRKDPTLPFQDWTVVDASTRADQDSRFEDYKLGRGFVLVVRASAYLAKPGLYLLRVNTTANPADLTITIGQVALRNLTTVQLLKSAGGWYTFEMRYHNPSAVVDIQMAEPNSGGEPALTYLPVFFVASPVPPRDYYYAPNIALSSTFQVLTNPSGPVNSSLILDNALQLNMLYRFSAVVEDIAFMTPTGLRDALFPDMTARDRPPRMVGLAHTRLRAPNTPMRFKVTCSICALYVNTLRVVDVYDPSRSGRTVTQISNCIIFGNVSSSSGAVHDLTLRFAINDTSAAPLLLTWLTCDSADSGDSAVSVTTHTFNNLFWKPSSGVAAYVSGMQCDLWAADDQARLPIQTAPLLKFRLPGALMQSRKGSAKEHSPIYNVGYVNAYDLLYKNCSSNETASPSCSANMAFTLRDIFTRGEYMKGSSFVSTVDIRCWTFVNAGFSNGLVQAKYSGTRDTWAHLGAQTILNTAITTVKEIRNQQYGASGTALNGYYQLLVIEWTKYPFDSLIEVYNGTNSTSTGSYLLIDTLRTLLPIPLVAVSSSSSSSPTEGPAAQTSNGNNRRLAAATAAAAASTSASAADYSRAHARLTDLHSNENAEGTFSLNEASAFKTDPAGDAGRALLQQEPLQQPQSTWSLLGGPYDPRSLGSSAYSPSQVPARPGLSATVLSPSGPYDTKLGLLIRTIPYNTTLDASTAPAASTCTSSAGLWGNVCGPPTRVFAPRYVQVAGFIRLPPGTDPQVSDGQLDRWVLRHRDAPDQSSMIVMGGVTIRNAGDFPASYLPEIETIITVPRRRGVDLYLPAVVLSRSNRTTTQSRYETGLLNPRTREETRVNETIWYGTLGLRAVGRH